MEPEPGAHVHRGASAMVGNLVGPVQRTRRAVAGGVVLHVVARTPLPQGATASGIGGGSAHP